MDSKSIDESVREHYEAQHMSAGREQVLTAMLSESMPAPTTSTSRSRAWMLAASLLLTATLGVIGTIVVLSAGGHLRTAPGPDERLAGGDQAFEVDIIAVQMKAEWCLPSQAIAPRIEELRREFDNSSILFVTLDLTDDARRHQAQLMMESLGLEEIWKAQRGVTGEMLLVDARRRVVLETLTEADDTGTMLAALRRCF